MILSLLVSSCHGEHAASATPAEPSEDDEGVASASLAPGEHVERVPSRPGVSLPLLVLEPSGTASAVVFLFPGGSGSLGLSNAGVARGADNFMVRTRQRFADAGFVAIVVDSPSDHPDGVGDYRVGAKSGEDVVQLALWARKRWTAPIWLVGTSRGTLSAANAVARGAPIQGLVLTASITGGRKATILDVPLYHIEIPTLLVHNPSDACEASPFDGVRHLEKALTHSRAVSIRTFDGGDPSRSSACGPLSYHGFLGLDAQVVGAIVEYVRAH